MKGQKLISILSVLVVVPLFAQQNQINDLERARSTIDKADSTSAQRQAAVMGSQQAPSLPNEPVFEVPSDQVFLDLPGGDTSSSSMAVDEETISVDFPEEDVRDIIRSVAELYELNVVIPDSLAGSVSLKLRDVTWQQVFDVVLEPLNFTYLTEGNIIKIKSRDELAVEPVDTRVFIVDFANAGEIRGSISPLIDEAAGGKVQVDTRSNALVITERPSRMNDIQEIIETLDRPTEQVMIESKFIEINERDSSKLGIDWKTLDAWELGLGSHGDSSPIDGVIVNYESRVQDISMKSAVFSAGTFNTVISALDTFNNLQLVSNPTVVTVNNSPANITIGDEYPIPNYTYNDEIGRMEVSGFVYKPIGINMRVTPQINSAGFINLDILPEISSTNGFVKFGSGGAGQVDIPIIKTRKTESRVTIKSGYTLAIGGLISQTTEEGESKVPLFGDFPVVGKFFNRDTSVVDRSNLIVFITAKILSASGATYDDVFDEEAMYEMGISNNDIPGQEPSEQDMLNYNKVMSERDQIEELRNELDRLQELDALEFESWQKQKGIERLELELQERKLKRDR